MHSPYTLTSLAFALTLGLIGCGGSKSSTTDETAGTAFESSSGSTSESTSTSTSDTSTSDATTTEGTTTSGGEFMHECPDSTSTSYEAEPYNPEPCQYGGSGHEYLFCSCRHHELCVTGLQVFFPSGMGGWEAAGVCASPCETTADCPAAPEGVTAVPECRELAGAKWCVLDCSEGKTCGEGTCSEEEVCVGTYVP